MKLSPAGQPAVARTHDDARIALDPEAATRVDASLIRTYAGVNSSHV
jgi:hypothetical protein